MVMSRRAAPIAVAGFFLCSLWTKDSKASHVTKNTSINEQKPIDNASGAHFCSLVLRMKENVPSAHN
jgi:hypothetical protein